MRLHTPRVQDALNHTRRAMVLATTLLAVTVAACMATAGSADGDGLVYGSAVQVGSGSAKSYVILEDGTPAEFGVALSESALTSLPPVDEAHPHGYEYLLPLPAWNPTPYKLLELNWNPAGHEPPGLYDAPHFDFHFYTITEAERNAIHPTDPSFQAKAERFPTAEFISAGYFTPPPVAAAPRMGVHWIHPASPELNGQPFTKTFIYGTWDGKVIFAEPMITKAFLDTKPDVETSIPVAQRHDPAGLYPGAYRVYWDQGTREYRIALSDFAQRQ